jgi:hypothetical protein
MQRQLAVFAFMAATAFASTTVRAAAINDTQESWTQHQQELAATNALWQCANVSLFASLPANLQAATAPPVRSESIAYWGWYGPGYRYGYWGPRPYRSYGYYRGYAAPYNTYYSGYPGYYYGPQVGVRVYPNGRVWRGYW